MKTRFYAILQDEITIIDKSTLEQINTIPDIKYIFKSEEDSIYEGKYGNFERCNFRLVDSKGTPENLKTSRFTIIDIGIEDIGPRVYSRKILIKDNYSNRLHEVESTVQGSRFLVAELLPLFNRLKDAGSWAIYEKLNEFDSLKEEVKLLKSKLLKLEEMNKTLKIS